MSIKPQNIDTYQRICIEIALFYTSKPAINESSPEEVFASAWRKSMMMRHQ
jgi:hypothetical protein